MGRDVVGFLTKELHKGLWHNYQCKQLGRRKVGVDVALLGLGKIIHFSHHGEFTLPEQYTFVAPRGLSRPLDVWSRDLVVRVMDEPGLLFRPGFADGFVGRETT